MKFLVVLALIAASTAAPFDTVNSRPVLPWKQDAEDAQSRIINGVNVPAGLLPYQVGIEIFDYLNQPLGYEFCGGSLISSEWVLTAAHCIYDCDKLILKLGSVTLYGGLSIEINRTDENVFVHGLFNFPDPHNDIALIKLPEPVDFTDYIKPIPLPQFVGFPDPTYEGFPVVASGWGKTSDNSGLSSTLKATYLQVIPNTECAPYFSINITSSILCAMTPDSTNKSTCMGDSGGPLAILYADYSFELIGVTSFVSSTSCELGNPAGFSRVTWFLEWIEWISGVTP